MSEIKVRPKKCKQCGQPFTPFRSFQKTCMETDCLVKQGRVLAEKRTQQAKREEDRAHREKVRKNKPLSWHINRTRTTCHDYIKARDFGLPCICCGEPIDWYGDKRQINAGHWKTQGSSGSVRFNEDNIFAQRAYCNGNQAGNQSAMELGMVERIGAERVEAVRKAAVIIKNWTREELDEIHEYYRAKLKELRKNNE